MTRAASSFGIGLRRVAIPALAALAIAATPVVVHAQGTVLMPPALDLATHCKANDKLPPALDRDWTLWAGEPVTTPALDLLAISNEYLQGNGRVARSADTAINILGYLNTEGSLGQSLLDRMTGRALIIRGASEEEIREGEALLLKALAAGEALATMDLTNLYGPNGPQSMRDPVKARHFAQRAAISGDVDGKLIYARIVYADASVPEQERAFAVESALTSLVGELGKGECRMLGVIGGLYLRGDLFPENVEVGLAWLKKAAEAGDSRIQEWLGRLLTSTVVAEGDFRLAMDYTEAAALQGRPGASLALGKAYVSGILRPKDLVAGERFLKVAADAGLTEGITWLARLYQGTYGSVPDPESARKVYELLLEKRPHDIDVLREFAEFLLASSTAPEDIKRARELLTQAALAGSGAAAAKVGVLLLADTRKDPSLYPQAETFLRLAADLGRPDAARQLASLYLCGGPHFSPEKASYWFDRAVALGSGGAMFPLGLTMLSSPDPQKQERGRALVMLATQSGDVRALAYSVAQLESGTGPLGSDPARAAALRDFVEHNADPLKREAFTVELTQAELEVPGGEARLDEVLAQLDAKAAAGDAEAGMLKAELLKQYRDVPPAELLPMYETAANAGLAKGMREFGLLLLGDAQGDIPTAQAWLQKAADMGDVKAALRLIDTSAEDAIARLQAIADASMACTVDEMLTVARGYAQTIDPAGPGQAEAWLEAAAYVAGSDAANLVKVADAYREGVGGLDRVASAESLLQRAAEMGEPSAKRKLADGHLRGQWPGADATEARVLLSDLADGGDPQAAARLLRTVADRTITSSADEVSRWVEIASGELQTSGGTLLKLARMDEQGEFGEQHPEQRVIWLERAAEAGNAEAMVRLYRAYANGIGVAAEPQLAVEWLLRAAGAGNPKAALELAAAYEVGFGVTADAQQAALWRERSTSAN